MDELQAISIALSILAILISIFVFADNRKKTRIMTEQLKITQEQVESKKEIRNFMKTISDVQEKITKITSMSYDWGDFGFIAYLRLLETLHDSGKTIITWKVKTLWFLGEVVLESSSEWTSFDSFLKRFEKLVSDPKTKMVIQFWSNPKLGASEGVEQKEIDVRDYFRDILLLQRISDELRSNKKIIGLYDISIPDDIQEIYLKIMRIIHQRILSGYELIIKPEMKTKDISNYLLTLIGFDVWTECIQDINGQIIPRLFDMQRRMLEVI